MRRANTGENLVELSDYINTERQNNLRVGTFTSEPMVEMYSGLSPIPFSNNELHIIDVHRHYTGFGNRPSANLKHMKRLEKDADYYNKWCFKLMKEINE